MVPTYMLNVKFTDLSGSIFITFPKELGDPLMNGLSASNFKNFREEYGGASNAGMMDDQNEDIRDFFYQTQFKVRSTLNVY